MYSENGNKCFNVQKEGNLRSTAEHVAPSVSQSGVANVLESNTKTNERLPHHEKNIMTNRKNIQFASDIEEDNSDKENESRNLISASRNKLKELIQMQDQRPTKSTKARDRAQSYDR